MVAEPPSGRQTLGPQEEVVTFPRALHYPFSMFIIPFYFYFSHFSLSILSPLYYGLLYSLSLYTLLHYFPLPVLSSPYSLTLSLSLTLWCTTTTTGLLMGSLPRYPKDFPRYPRVPSLHYPFGPYTHYFFLYFYFLYFPQGTRSLLSFFLCKPLLLTAAPLLA